MFKKAKIEERVWSFTHHWGTIIGIDDDSNESTYPLLVKFDDNIALRYTIDGKYNSDDKYPTLFWNEIKYEIPKKTFNLEEAFNILKEIEFDQEGFENAFIYYDKDDYELNWDTTNYRKYLGVKFFTKESILEFFEEIKFKNISEKEFFDAYNKVFGGNK